MDRLEDRRFRIAPFAQDLLQAARVLDARRVMVQAEDGTPDPRRLLQHPPHLHLCFTLITEEGRLSAKEILGNRAQLSKWQDEFHAHMKKAFPVLKRGESALVTKRKHIPTWLFKQSVDLTRQQQAIEKAVSEIGVLNAGKKRDEILEMVGPYFSRLEKHLGQMKKYQATIDYLTQENEGLKEKVNSEKSIQKQMEVLTLKKENERLRRFVDSIPPEVRRILREQQRQQRPKDHDL